MALRLVHFTRFPPRSTLFTPKSFFHSQPSLLVHRHHKKGALSAEIEREIAKRKGHLAETNSKELELIKENMETMKEKLFQIHLKKDETSSEFDDSDEAEDFKQGFKHSTARAFEKKARMSLTCTEFDSEGRIIASSVKRLKTDLCQKHGLHTRDLRSIDSVRNQMPSILVRESAILVNLEHIKALIKPDEVVLFETIDADHYYQSLFIFDLQERLHDPSSANLPFELKVFESILVSVGYGLRDQLQKLSPKVLSLLRKLETNRIDRDTLFSILDLSKKLTKFEARINGVSSALMEILNSDDDMAGMYLSTKRETGQSRPVHMHEDVEFMLEFYTKQIEDIDSQTVQLIANINTTQSVIKITLDSQRNTLLLLELRLVMLSVSISTGALITGAFGMNLFNGFESHPFAFYLVSSGVFSGVMLGFVLLTRKLRNVVRTD